MPFFKDILDHEFIKEYEVPELELPDFDDGNSEEQKERIKYLWKGRPSQDFRLWNSRTEKDLLLGSLMVIGILAVFWGLIFLFVILFEISGRFPQGDLVKRATMIWIYIPVPVILFLLYHDYKDYLFRNRSKYFVFKKGVGFVLGNKKKKKYLIEWHQINELWFSKLESRFYFVLNQKTTKKINTSSPNSDEQEDSPFFEVFAKNDLNQLFEIFRKYKKVVMK